MRSRDKSLFIVASVILLAIGIVACGPAQDPEDEAATATAAAALPGESADTPEEVTQSEVTVDSEGEPSAAPENVEESAFDIYAGLGEDAFEATGTGLRYAILEKGDGGEQPVAGQVVSVHYSGWLEDGTLFDSSIDRGQPFSFLLGQGGVIAGWDEGIALLEVGDKARLIIPGELGYGETGSGPIPPNATLIFDVELVDVAAGPPEEPIAVNADDYVVKDNGLQYYDMVVGDGQVVEAGLVVTMDFTAWLDDGTLLGSSIGSGRPLSAILDGSQLFPGWEDGLLGMQVGGSRQLVIPPDLAFGETGTADGIVPPNATIIIEVDLLDAFSPSQ